MKENILNFFVAIFSFLDAGWRFLITLFLLLTLFVVNIVLTVKVKTYTERKKRAFLLLSLALILMQAFSSAVLEENLSLSLFNGAIFLFTIVPFSFITKKEKKEMEERIEELTREKEEMKTAYAKLVEENKKEVEEKEEVKDLVLSAAGVDYSRGDVISISGLQFEGVKIDKVANDEFTKQYQQEQLVYTITSSVIPLISAMAATT